MKHPIRFLFVLALGLSGSALLAQSAPNVILIVTDDQGIGDLGCHGNPWLKTPNLDAFYQSSVRLTDFHVSPLCTPSRAALMTGQYPINNGAWATYKGRDALSDGVYTMANLFQSQGYQTALFGKWHLGDNYPVRPTDCGFETAIHHQAGGVGELSDYWGNSYFEDVYLVNNEPKQFEGYCTDIWFAETMKFIEHQQEKPFFVYLATNAPHDPLIVDSSYAAPYKHLEGDQIVSANLYGMIANIDENFGRLIDFLDKKDLAENTIVIFMTDNGTRFGYSPDGKLGYNMGLKGIKGSKWEGGHRVPFFIKWPQKNVGGGRDLPHLSAHVDILPTLAGLCDLPLPEGLALDGRNLSNLITGKTDSLPQQSVFVHHRQDWRPPDPIQQSCILQGPWRLVNGQALYHIIQDPLQQNDVAEAHPDLVQSLLAQNTHFFDQSQARTTFSELPCAVVGSGYQQETKLTIQHAIGDAKGIWKAEQVAEGVKNPNSTYAIEIAEKGNYLISCRRWPKECPGPLWGTPTENPKNLFSYQPIQPEKVQIKIANQILEKMVDGKEEAVTFQVQLSPGKTLLTCDFIEGNESYGVYYTYLSKVK